MTKKYDAKEMRDRFKACLDADDGDRDRAAEDWKFAFKAGEQWDANTKTLRGQQPCYEFNKLRPAIRQVTGQMRQNPPGIKLRAVEDSDQDTAETMQGLVRNIWSVSNGDTASATAYEWAVTTGYGIFTVATEYTDDEAFDLDIVIKEARNPLAYYCDPAAKEFDRRDARFWFEMDSIPRDEFKRLYPDKQATSFDAGGATGDPTLQTWWRTDGSVRIAKYWRKVPYTKVVLLLTDGKTVEEDEYTAIADELAAQGINIATDSKGQPRRREVECDEVICSIVSGSEELSEQTVWPGKYIPIVPVWGDLVNVDGIDRFSGMVRWGRDAQVLYNYERSTFVETLAQQPRSPFIGTAAQFAGWEGEWNSLANGNRPWIPYNHVDGQSAPQRSMPPQFPAAYAQAGQISSEDLKAVTGIFAPGLGENQSSQSGRAVIALQNKGDTINYAYVDNLGRSMKFTGDILVDLIPKVIDTERAARILGEDGAEKYVKLNQPVQDQQTGEWTVLNDLAKGKYDVITTVGPSFATQRQELLQAMTELGGTNSPMAPIFQYTALKSMDIPQAEESLKAARKMLVMQGLLEPEEGEQPPEQKGPSPEDQAKAMKAIADADKAKADTGKSIAETKKIEVETDILAQQAPHHVLKAAADADHATAESFYNNPGMPNRPVEPDGDEGMPPM